MLLQDTTQLLLLQDTTVSAVSSDDVQRRPAARPSAMYKYVSI